MIEQGLGLLEVVVAVVIVRIAMMMYGMTSEGNAETKDVHMNIIRWHHLLLL
jgi:hypothetical protein